MRTADLIIILLLAVACVGIGLLVRGQVLRTRAEGQVVEDALVPERTADGGLAIRLPGGGNEPVFELAPLNHHQVETLAGRRPVEFTRAASGPAALLASLVSYLPMTESQTHYVVRFRPHIEALLRSQELELVRTKSGYMAAARNGKGQIAGHGRIVSQEFAQLSSTQLLSALAVVGVVLLKLEQISDAVERIEGKLGEIGQRLQDDDHGELQAAEALVEVVSGLLTSGGVPGQLASELAIARQRVDGIYFSRQRFVDRFRLRIEQLQQEERDRKGDNARAWARGAAREFSQKEALSEEALLYARAMVNRAQLAFLTAGAISLERGRNEAVTVLRHAEAELTASFTAFDRLLRDLAEERPKWAWVPFNDRKEVHDEARRLAALFSNEVAPLLPRKTGEVLEFVVSTEPGSGAPIALSAAPSQMAVGDGAT